jgi:UDP-N-acetyl-D-galactosamine dehydrogenase
MNELSLIFDKVGINTRDVLDAAGTKWNFHKYTPGLVGGHCIGIDPYYLTHKAQQLGYEPKVILAGQDVNEYMVELVAKKFDGRKNILVLGITFKENVPDARNTKALEIMNRLKTNGTQVFWHDPVYTEKHKPEEFSSFPYVAKLGDAQAKYDGVLVFSPHQIFATYGIDSLRVSCVESEPLIFDVKGFFSREIMEKAGFKYMTL